MFLDKVKIQFIESFFNLFVAIENQITPHLYLYRIIHLNVLFFNLFFAYKKVAFTNIKLL